MLDMTNGMYGKKHSLETIAKMRLAKLGNKASLETRNKMRISSKKSNNSGRFKKGHYTWNKGLTIEDERVKKNIENSINTKIEQNILHNFGKDNPNWRGGVNSLNNSIRKSKEMKKWNTEILKRDNYRCVHCGVNNNSLEVHHKTALSIMIKQYNIKNIQDVINCEHLWNIVIGETVCENCHIEVDPIKKKFFGGTIDVAATC